MLFFNDKNIDYKKIEVEINNKGIIIYPTDTVYGVGGSIYSDDAIKKIYEVKERNFNSPLIALISDVEKLYKIANIPEVNKEKVELLIKNFWPGGLTIILEKKEWISNLMTSNKRTIGVRMPNLDIALNIIKSCGGILPTTSANISGESTPKKYNDLNQKIINRVDILVETKEKLIGTASTIIDMTTKEIKILREGSILKENIEKIIGKID